MPRLLPEQYAKILYEITQGVSENELDTAVGEFMKLLERDQVLSKVTYIMDAFEAYAKKQAGIERITVTSARDLSPALMNKIAGIFGKAVEVSTTIDPTLLGGVKIRSEHTVFDGSVRTQLERFKTQLS